MNGNGMNGGMNNGMNHYGMNNNQMNRNGMNGYSANGGGGNENEANDQTVLKKIRNVTYVFSLIYVIVGIALIAAPNVMINVLGFILGLLAFALGIYRLVVYFTQQRIESYLATDLFAGVLLAVLGFICLIYHNQVLTYVTIIFGVLLIFGSVLKMQYSIIMQKVGHLYWWIALILGMVSVVFSVLAIMKPPFIANMYVVVVGAFLLYDGITSLVTAFLGEHFMKQLRKGITKGWGHAPDPSQIPPAQNNQAFATNQPGWSQGYAQNGTYPQQAAGMSAVPAPEQKKNSFLSGFSSLFKKKEKESPAGEGLGHPQAGDPFSSTPSGDASMAGVSFDAGKEAASSPAPESTAVPASAEAPEAEAPSEETEEVVEESVLTPDAPDSDGEADQDPLQELKPDPVAPGEEMPKPRFDPETGKPIE